MLRYQYSDDNEFGMRLRQARKDAGLTLQACADRLNHRYGMCINKGSISKYENGIHEPSISLVHCLSEILEVDRDYLLGRSEQPYTDDSETNLIHFKIDDDSMAPRYLPGDLLLISTCSKPRNGMYCLVRSDNDRRLVRRLIRNQYGWVLRALNPNYEDIIVGFHSLADLRYSSNELVSNYSDSVDGLRDEKSFMIEGIVIELRRRELFSEQH